jgi:hypothetical protein
VLLIALLVTVAALCAATAAQAEFGMERFAISARNQNGTPDVQAGSHPYSLTTTFVLNQPLCNGETCVAEGNLKDARVELPPGFVGDPNATPRCPYQQFANPNVGCPSDTAVGLATSYLGHERQSVSPPDVVPDTVAVFNLVPPPGVAAEFGYIVGGETPVLLETSLRTGSDYGLTTAASDVNQALLAYASKVTIWGVPASPAHNPLRGGCERVVGGRPTPVETPGFGLREGEDELEGPIYPLSEADIGLPESNCESSSDAPELPLLTMPTSCGQSLTATLKVDSWKEPGNFSGSRTRSVSLPPLAGCEKLQFSSSLSVKPEKSLASTPSGLTAELEIPQEGLESPIGLAASDVKDGTMVFPEALQLNASAANGLGTCSPAQIGFTGFAELNKAGEPGVQTPQFTARLKNAATGEEEPDLCPSASRVGNVHISSPLLEGELVGGVYQAAPQNFTGGTEENPFRSLLALYAVVEEPKTGVLVKIPIKVTPSATGQLTGSIEHAPPLPFRTLKLEFYGGERAPLATPNHCGTYNTSLSLTPWAGGLPFNVSEDFKVTSGLGGTACPGGGALPFAPALVADGASTTAGAFSALSTSLGREDGQQEIQGATVTYPPGVSAVLAGVPLCGEAQANAGTCPPESQIAEDTASIGFGQDPYTVTGGKVYLTGPYQGAPFGLSIVTPAKAGPFVLQQGAPVITRAKVEVNPTTAQVTVAITGAIPHIIEGIPVEIKHVNVTVTRPNFTINPTSCNPMAVTGTVTGWEGTTSPVSTPFQVGSCEHLAFSPKFTVATTGHTSKLLGASLVTKIEEPAGALTTQANIAKVKVQLPLQLPSQLKTLQKACLAKTFEASPAACLAESPHAKVGEATVHTPLLPVPLTGNAYLVSHGGEAFPNLTLVLQGDNVTIVLVGTTNIKNGITTTTFKTTPDVPFTSFVLTLPQGEYSALGPNLPESAKGSFCGQNLVMPTEIIAQNGMAVYQNTQIAVTGCPPAVTVTKAKVKGNSVMVTVKTGQTGTLVLSGKGIRKKTLRGLKAGTHTVSVSLTSTGRAAARHRRKLSITAALTAGGKTGTAARTLRA